MSEKKDLMRLEEDLMSSGTDGFSDNDDMEELPPTYSSIFEEGSINPPLPVPETDEKLPATFESKKNAKARRAEEQAKPLSRNLLIFLFLISHGRWPFQHRPECGITDICIFTNLGDTSTGPKNNRCWTRDQAEAIPRRGNRRNV